MITALYASLLAVLLFIMSIRAISWSGNPAFAFIAKGKGDDELLQRATRAHDSWHGKAVGFSQGAAPPKPSVEGAGRAWGCRLANVSGHSIPEPSCPTPILDD